jgi:outer membrane biosynthesis protein TonB
LDERRSYWAWAVSSTLHGALVLLLILGFASARKFDDSQEAIPVETVSQTQLNQIMNGEKDAKPAPMPPPAPRTEAKSETKPEPAPPTPPEPPPELRTAQEATSTPKPEPMPPPKPEPAPTPKPAEKQADVPKPMPKPPERPKEPAPKPKIDPIAKALEHDKTEPQPTQRYDPNAIAKLIAPKPSPASGAASESDAPAATPQGLPHHDAPRMSVSMASALDAWLTESYLNCWTPPPTMPEGDVYVAEIKVVLNVDGSLSARPILLNPPNDPAWKAHAESAMRAVRKCDPLRVPPEYAPFFEEWKIETIHFDPRETQG